MDCDGDVVLSVLVVLVALVVRDGDVVRCGGVQLFRGAPPLVAQHCYKSTHYARNISNSTACS